MSNSRKNTRGKRNLERSNSELYKELEISNFRAVLVKTPEKETGESESISMIAGRKLQTWASNNKISPEKKKYLNKRMPENQYTVFQRAMKVLLICGQSFGLNPVLGILETEPAKVRFKIYSWRFVYSVIICIAQAIATILCFYRLLKSTVSISMLAFVSFYASTCLTSILFLRIAVKWPELVREISTIALEEYNDSRLKLKCDTATALLIALSFVEHILSLIARIAEILDCFPESKDLYRAYIERTFPWLFELGLPYYLPFGIILQFVNITSTMNWNYSDLFIVCMSIYLTSILQQLNKKILNAGGRYLPPSFWRSLREDYNRATRLVRQFDEVISSIIFTSFASNLFFICLQLFNVLANGFKHGLSVDLCPRFPSGPFGGYEHAAYFMFSMWFVLARYLTVSLVAANVHSASLVPAPALYDVPSPVYCTEVQRFLEQIHGDTVALSGLQFFYVTKGLVLTVAGTIVTYELVLLQFSGEEMIKK